MGTDFYSNSPI
jgi:ubiquitin fusion degradation protein 1